MVSSNNRRTVKIPATLEIGKLGETIAQIQTLLRTLEVRLGT